MKNIVIITKTADRYSHINLSLLKLSEGQIKTSNTFFPVKRLSKFKRNNFYQLFFHDTDLLIIDQEIYVKNLATGEDITLLRKIKTLNVLNRNTKVLVLINRNFEAKEEGFESFVFTQNAKADQFMPLLFEKVKEILLK